MFFNIKRPVNPTLITVISAPHFIFGGLLAAFNWQRLGFPRKARATIKWSIIGTFVFIVIAFYVPMNVLKKMWSIWVGINLGTGMALRTLQLPDYNKAMDKLKK